MTEPDRLSHIAELAHNGGMANLSQSDVLSAIRRLTLCYWPRTSDSAAAGRVSAAIAASRSPTIHYGPHFTESDAGPKLTTEENYGHE
jgi:hypothetical protein